MLKKTVQIKNEFIQHADSLEKLFIETKADIHKLVEQRDEVINQLAKQRIITSDLTNQIINIKAFLKDADISKDSLNELLTKTKEYLIECSCCHTRINGTIDEIVSTPACKKCGDKASWEIMTRVLA